MKHWKLVFALGLAVTALLTGCFFNTPESAATGSTESHKETQEKPGEDHMKIKVTDGTNTITFALNGSRAARDLYAQLPLTIRVENYSSEEKIFYPKKLNTSGTPAANAKVKVGTLAYYAPWGDVVMYYRDFSSGSGAGLYELGTAESGKENIQNLNGQITISAIN